MSIITLTVSEVDVLNFEFNNSMLKLQFALFKVSNKMYESSTLFVANSNTQRFIAIFTVPLVVSFKPNTSLSLLCIVQKAAFLMR